jgi:curli biogenesis system outer membrane secretion channel CsgG
METTTKSIFRLTDLCVLAVAVSSLWFASCATQKARQPAYSADSLTLDAAISKAVVYFVQRLPTNAKIALVPFESPTGRLSDYVFEELWGRFEDTHNFVMVDRKNLERIEAEIKIQYESGKVDDNLMISMTKQYGAEILVYGQMTSLGQGPLGQGPLGQGPLGPGPFRARCFSRIPHDGLCYRC